MFPDNVFFFLNSFSFFVDVDVFLTSFFLPDFVDDVFECGVWRAWEMNT